MQKLPCVTFICSFNCNVCILFDGHIYKRPQIFNLSSMVLSPLVTIEHNFVTFSDTKRSVLISFCQFMCHISFLPNSYSSYSFGQYCSRFCWEHSSTYGIHIVLESKSLPKMPNFLLDMVMVCNWGNVQVVLFMLHFFCFHLKNYCFMYSVISVINKDAFYVLKNVFYWHLFCFTEVCIF